MRLQPELGHAPADDNVVLVGGPFEGYAVAAARGCMAIVVKGEPDRFGMKQRSLYFREGDGRAFFRGSWVSGPGGPAVGEG